MKKTEINLLKANMTTVTVSGYDVVIDGFGAYSFVVHRSLNGAGEPSNSWWTVSEKSTGLAIGTARNREQAIAETKRILDAKGKAELDRHIDMGLKLRGRMLSEKAFQVALGFCWQCSMPTMVQFKKDIADSINPEQRQRLNTQIRHVAHVRATQMDAAKSAYIVYMNKGHQWGIMNGYQRLYDEGVDCPVTCARCGEWDF